MIRQIEILFEDEAIIAFNKPAGLLSIPDRFQTELPCMYHYAMQQVGQKLWLLHRLDKETSGLILFAKNEVAHRKFSELFQNNLFQKYYIALVEGNPTNVSGSIIEPILENQSRRGTMMIHPKGKFAHTDYVLLQKWKGYSLLKLQLHTGRTHQIRVHAKHIGHPIVCDSIYGSTKGILLSELKRIYRQPGRQKEEASLIKRLALHASGIAWVDDLDEQHLIEAPYPKDIQIVIKQLDKWGA